MKKQKTSMKVPYAQAVFGQDEIDAVVAVLKNPSKIVAGPQVKEFEHRIAKLFGKKYGVMVNSGSSANLIGLEVLNLPRGAEVITPILTFSTTLAPLVQKGLVPVFADVEFGTYVIDCDQVESLITKKTKALMIPSLFGSLPDFTRLRSLAERHGLYFIEDSCDTVGATFKGKPTGVFSDISTTSFYASHIITAAGGGGMVCFNDKTLAKRALVMSNWGRQSTLFGSYEKSEDIRKRFAGKIDGETYDAKFIFSEIGYNFQPTEVMGAFGLTQLKSFNQFSLRRKANFNNLFTFFKRYEEFFFLPRLIEGGSTNWLAFPLMLRNNTPFSRYALTKFLEERDIQTRPIFTGNVLKQPGFKAIAPRRVIKRGYPVTDTIMRNGFVIGCHHGLTDLHLSYIKEAFEDFFARL